jgi:hypothetical protein
VYKGREARTLGLLDLDTNVSMSSSASRLARFMDFTMGVLAAASPEAAILPST